MPGSDEILQRLVTEMGYEVDEAGRKKAEQATDDLGTKAVAKGQLIASAIGKGVNLAVGAIGGLIGGLKNALLEFGELGSEISDTASASGVSTRELQRLRVAAERAGGSASAMDGALKKLNVGLTEARTKGTGPFADGLKLVGVELDELQGMKAEDQIGLLGEALALIEDPAKKATAAARLFGEESGPKLLELLQGGREGIRGLGDDAERLGLVMGDDAVKAAGDFDDAVKLAEMQVKALGGRVVGQLAPGLSEMGERFADWIAENDDFIEQDLPGAILAVVEAGADLLVWIADVIHEFGQFGKLVKDTWDDVESFGKTLEDEFGPALQAVGGFLGGVADGFVEVTSAIGEGIAKVLEYIGVLDTLREAWNLLPFTGESIDDLTARLHGGASTRRGPASFADPVNEGARQARAVNDAIAVATAMAASERATADATALADSGRATEARRRARARARGERSLRGGGGGGGGKSSGGGGNPFADLWNAITGTPEPTFLDRAAAAIGLGEGGGGHAAAGGSGSPLAGATFNRIDASLHVGPTTVEVNVPLEALAGADPETIGKRIGGGISDELAARNRTLFDHLQQTVRGL